jgi:hypothetical protein
MQILNLCFVSSIERDLRKTASKTALAIFFRPQCSQIMNLGSSLQENDVRHKYKFYILLIVHTREIKSSMLHRAALRTATSSGSRIGKESCDFTISLK